MIAIKLTFSLGVNQQTILLLMARGFHDFLSPRPEMRIFLNMMQQPFLSESTPNGRRVECIHALRLSLMKAQKRRIEASAKDRKLYVLLGDAGKQSRTPFNCPSVNKCLLQRMPQSCGDLLVDAFCCGSPALPSKCPPAVSN